MSENAARSRDDDRCSAADAWGVRCERQVGHEGWHTAYTFDGHHYIFGTTVGNLITREASDA